MRGHRCHFVRRRVELVGIADEVFRGRRLGQGPNHVAQRQERSDDHEGGVGKEVAEGENDHGQAAEAEHFDLRDAVGRGVDIAARHPESRVADKKGREENHEVFQLEADGRADKSNDTAEEEDRNG